VDRVGKVLAVIDGIIFIAMSNATCEENIIVRRKQRFFI